MVIKFKSVEEKLVISKDFLNVFGIGDESDDKIPFSDEISGICTFIIILYELLFNEKLSTDNFTNMTNAICDKEVRLLLNCCGNFINQNSEWKFFKTNLKRCVAKCFNTLINLNINGGKTSNSLLISSPYLTCILSNIIINSYSLNEEDLDIYMLTLTLTQNITALMTEVQLTNSFFTKTKFLRSLTPTIRILVDLIVLNNNNNNTEVSPDWNINCLKLYLGIIFNLTTTTTTKNGKTTDDDNLNSCSSSLHARQLLPDFKCILAELLSELSNLFVISYDMSRIDILEHVGLILSNLSQTIAENPDEYIPALLRYRTETSDEPPLKSSSGRLYNHNQRQQQQEDYTCMKKFLDILTEHLKSSTPNMSLVINAAAIFWALSYVSIRDPLFTHIYGSYLTDRECLTHVTKLVRSKNVRLSNFAWGITLNIYRNFVCDNGDSALEPSTAEKSSVRFSTSQNGGGAESVDNELLFENTPVMFSPQSSNNSLTSSILASSIAAAETAHDRDEEIESSVFSTEFHDDLKSVHESQLPSSCPSPLILIPEGGHSEDLNASKILREGSLSRSSSSSLGHDSTKSDSKTFWWKQQLSFKKDYASMHDDLSSAPNPKADDILSALNLKADVISSALNLKADDVFSALNSFNLKADDNADEDEVEDVDDIDVEEEREIIDSCIRSAFPFDRGSESTALLQISKSRRTRSLLSLTELSVQPPYLRRHHPPIHFLTDRIEMTCKSQDLIGATHYHNVHIKKKEKTIFKQEDTRICEVVVGGVTNGERQGIVNTATTNNNQELDDKIQIFATEDTPFSLSFEELPMLTTAVKRSGRHSIRDGEDVHNIDDGVHTYATEGTPFYVVTRPTSPKTNSSKKDKVSTHLDDDDDDPTYSSRPLNGDLFTTLRDRRHSLLHLSSRLNNTNTNNNTDDEDVKIYDVENTPALFSKNSSLSDLSPNKQVSGNNSNTSPTPYQVESNGVNLYHPGGEKATTHQQEPDEFYLAPNALQFNYLVRYGEELVDEEPLIPFYDKYDDKYELLVDANTTAPIYYTATTTTINRPEESAVTSSSASSLASTDLSADEKDLLNQCIISAMPANPLQQQVLSDDGCPVATLDSPHLLAKQFFSGRRNEILLESTSTRSRHFSFDSRRLSSSRSALSHSVISSSIIGIDDEMPCDLITNDDEDDDNSGLNGDEGDNDLNNYDNGGGCYQTRQNHNLGCPFPFTSRNRNTSYTLLYGDGDGRGNRNLSMPPPPSNFVVASTTASLGCLKTTTSSSSVASASFFTCLPQFQEFGRTPAYPVASRTAIGHPNLVTHTSFPSSIYLPDLATIENERLSLVSMTTTTSEDYHSNFSPALISRHCSSMKQQQDQLSSYLVNQSDTKLFAPDEISPPRKMVKQRTFVKYVTPAPITDSSDHKTNDFPVPISRSNEDNLTTIIPINVTTTINPHKFVKACPTAVTTTLKRGSKGAGKQARKMATASSTATNVDNGKDGRNFKKSSQSGAGGNGSAALKIRKYQKATCSATAGLTNQSHIPRYKK